MQNKAYWRRLLILCALFSLGASARASEHWVTYENCRLLSNPANDGDSFHVRAEDKEYIFRLYFVDSPETESSLPERIADQAKYFQTTPPEVLRVGVAAEHFTTQALGRPFTVVTCKEDARGRSRLRRYFAFIKIGNEDLAEDLVSNGLARIYGAPGRPPDGVSAKSEREKLARLELTAKAQKLGAWGIKVGRLNVRAVASPTPGADSFKDFFHPTPTPGAASVAEAASPAHDKLDINTATREQLENLPGIGPVLAGRIMAARPFQQADDLRRVSGIGAKRFAALRPYFR